MGFRWLVNAGLLALPVGATLGILLGIDSHRHSAGQEPLFNGDNGSGSGGGSGGSGGNNGITSKQYCQKQVGVSPFSKGSRYILNNNQWGWTEGTPGAMCMNVTSFNNNTYATSTTAPSYFVTWQYPPGPDTQPVHAFPNIQVDGSTVPTKLSSVQRINLAMQWTYGIGNVPAVSTDVNALNLNRVNANVAVDMFLDDNQSNSVNNSLAAYEVMVWFADFGSAAQPIGLKAGAVTTEVLNGTTFNLYTGKNSFQQNVLTWAAADMTEVFSGDIAPLITRLATIDSVKLPIASLYLGHLGIGSEAFSSDVNVTFSMPVLSMDIKT